MNATQYSVSRCVMRHSIRTSNPHHRFCFLSSYEEHNVPLTRIDIVVFKEERLIDTILLERRELNQQVKRARKCFLKY